MNIKQELQALVDNGQDYGTYSWGHGCKIKSTDLQAIIDKIDDDSDVMSKATYKGYRECLAIRERIHCERVHDAHSDGYHMGTNKPYPLETHQIKACLHKAQQIVEDVEAMIEIADKGQTDE